MKRKKDSSVCFVIPTNRHEVDWLIGGCLKIFPSAKIIIVDDGKGIKRRKTKNISIISHSQCRGLALSLIDGYKKALDSNCEFIVRVDADGEYPLWPVARIIQSLRNDIRYSCAFIETRRSLIGNGVLDGIFHMAFGYIEGIILFGFPFCQHSPGLHIYRRDVVSAFYPLLGDIVSVNGLTWGMDLITLTLARRCGLILQFTVDNPDWHERRSIRKILNQAVAAIKIMKFIKKVI